MVHVAQASITRHVCQSLGGVSLEGCDEILVWPAWLGMRALLVLVSSSAPVLARKTLAANCPQRGIRSISN